MLCGSSVVSESERGSGLGTLLVKEVVAAAREAGCYKLVATSRASRPKVHVLYERLGFTNYGVEFRMNLDAADAGEHRITIATAGQIANLKPQGS